MQKPGKIPATENDLRDTDEYSPVSQKVVSMIEPQNGLERLSLIAVFAQTYSSKYVDKVSDVMNSLNISGIRNPVLWNLGLC